jgi:hypothetical protein
MRTPTLYVQNKEGLWRPMREVVEYCEHRGHYIGAEGMLWKRCPDDGGTLQVCIECEPEWLLWHAHGECLCVDFRRPF